MQTDQELNDGPAAAGSLRADRARGQEVACQWVCLIALAPWRGMKRTGGQCLPGVIKQSRGPCRKAEQLAATRFIEL